MDCECIKNFWDQIPQDDKIYKASSENALIISAPKIDIWKKVFDKLMTKTSPGIHVISATGPELLKEAENENPDRIITLDEKNYKHKGGIYVVHHGTGTWVNADTDNSNQKKI
jgi:hypothetical protein